MKFLCLGYFDEAQWSKLTDQEREARMQTCMTYDQVLREGGHFAGGDCLDSAQTAVTLKKVDGKVVRSDGPFTETKEVLGGILHLEAEDMAQAVQLIENHPGLGMGPFEIRPTVNLSPDPKDQVLEVMARWRRALEAKDSQAMMQDYLESAVFFDAVPPYKVVGRDNIKKTWDHCLPFFPEGFRSEHRDLHIEVEGDLATVHGLHHFITEDPSHPCGLSWSRISMTFRRHRGAWKVAHEHISLPFNPMNNQVWSIKDPEVLDAPDYCAAMKEA